MTAAQTPGPSRPVREVGGLVRAVRGSLAGRDLAAAAATLTYFSGIAVVAWLLLAVWTSTWWPWSDGAAQAADRLHRLRVLVPDDMGARTPYDALVAAGTGMGPASALVLLFPASFYGEGLRRAALTLRGRPDEQRFTGWRSRLGVLPLVVPLPLLTWAWLAVGDLLVPLSPEGGGGGLADRLLRIVVGFVATWLVLAVLLAWVFAVVVPEPARPWVAVVAGLATGSFLAGFLHGFQLFLAIPIDVGLPYAGIGVVGGTVAVGLWLFVLHLFLLVGWLVAARLEDRAARGDWEAVS